MNDPNTSCDFCSEWKGERLFTFEPEKGHTFSVLQCQNCKVARTDPSLEEEAIARWYPPQYYGDRNSRFWAPLEYLIRFFRKRRARMIARYADPGPVLDVGCGRGHLLSHLRALGYEPHGVEISEYAAWFVKNHVRAEVFIGSFEKAPYASATFNVLIFWHSLEHFRKPREALERASLLLKPDGILVVAVPNFNSLQARLSGREWFHLDLPRHYFHFSESTLRTALENCGLRVIRTSHFSLEQNLYSWIQSLYNLLGFQYNLLYSFVKNRSSRTLSLSRYPFQILMILFTLPAVFILSCFLWALEIVLRRGGTIELIAHKGARCDSSQPV